MFFETGINWLPSVIEHWRISWCFAHLSLHIASLPLFVRKLLVFKYTMASRSWNNDLNISIVRRGTHRTPFFQNFFFISHVGEHACPHVSNVLVLWEVDTRNMHPLTSQIVVDRTFEIINWWWKRKTHKLFGLLVSWLNLQLCHFGISRGNVFNISLSIDVGELLAQ